MGFYINIYNDFFLSNIYVCLYINILEYIVKRLYEFEEKL